MQFVILVPVNRAVIKLILISVGKFYCKLSSFNCDWLSKRKLSCVKMVQEAILPQFTTNLLKAEI